MATIQTIADGEQLAQVRSKINSNFANLNTEKIEKTGKTDGTQTVFGNGTDQTKISPTGAITLEGNATVWEDANVDPTILTGAGNLPTSTIFASTTTHIAGFSGTQTDEVEFCFEIPHKAKLNALGETSVVGYFHAHTYATTATVGNVRLGLEYFFTKEGVAVTTSTIIYLTYTTSGTAWAKHSVEFSDIPMPDELGSQFHGRFFRLGADVLDTYSGTVGISTIGLHYEIDSVGSDQKFVK